MQKIDIKKYSKIIIIGSPGSGKTYLSIQLEKYLNYEIFHLENIFWNDNLVHLSDNELNMKIREITNINNWIIEGTFLKSLEFRISKADLIIFLDICVDDCIEGVLSRTDINKKIHGCEDYDGFLKYIRNFPKSGKKQIEKLLSCYNEKKIIRLNTRDEVNNFIESISSSDL